LQRQNRGHQVSTIKIKNSDYEENSAAPATKRLAAMRACLVWRLQAINVRFFWEWRKLQVAYVLTQLPSSRN
jgi:hypothetical protein